MPSDASLEASSLGRIRVIPWKHPNGNTYGGNPTYGQWDGRRFLYARKGHKTRRVARLVCEAFNGVPAKEGVVCMHDDENARNNVPGNLVWGTQKTNLNYPGFISYCQSGKPGNRSKAA